MWKIFQITLNPLEAVLWIYEWLLHIPLKNQVFSVPNWMPKIKICNMNLYICFYICQKAITITNNNNNEVLQTLLMATFRGGGGEEWAGEIIPTLLWRGTDVQ